MLIRSKQTKLDQIITEKDWDYLCKNGYKHKFDVISHEGNTIVPKMVDLREVTFPKEIDSIIFMDLHTKSEIISMVEIAISNGIELEYKKTFNKQQLTDILHG